MYEEQPDTLEIRYKGKSYQFPIVESTAGERAVKIASLRSETWFDHF